MRAMWFCFCAITYTHLHAGLIDPELGLLDVSVKIVDEKGEPVTNAKIKLYFPHTRSQRMEGAPSTKVFDSRYDGENPVRKIYAGRRSVGIRSEKEGYWPSSTGHEFSEEDRIGMRDGSPGGHYAKEFTVVLREKKNPRPLYLHKVDRLEIPGYDQPYGYDLEKADWVSPHGEGLRADFTFTVHGERVNKIEYRVDVDISFSNEDDGLIEIGKSELSQSHLLLGHNAPVDGYATEYRDFWGIGSQQGELVFLNPNRERVWEKIEGYWLRIRSQPDEISEGGVKARYGKIYGPIKLSGKPEENPLISFTYFLSPDFSGSLEYNGENLMKKRGGNLNSVRKN